MQSQQQPGDIAQRFEAAWNSHDMDAFAELFHPDATFVNRFATYWRGADAIVEGHRGIHRTIYRDSWLSIDDADVDMIGEDIAILHFWTRLSVGEAHPAGPHQLDTLIMAVVTKQTGRWRIRAAENVTLVDPATGRAMLRKVDA